MKTRCAVATLMLGLLFPLALQAGDEPPKKDDEAFRAAEAAFRLAVEVGQQSPLNATYEEIEIMRRLIVQRLYKAYPGLTPAQPFTSNVNGRYPAGDTFDVYSSSVWIEYPHRVPALDVQGVYLKGQGILFTWTLPGGIPMLGPRDVKPEGKALSDWERIQKEVRGEKVEAAPAAPAGPPPLADVLLKLLAEHGHRFSQLPETESVTFVVSLSLDVTMPANAFWKTGIRDYENLNRWPYGANPARSPYGKPAPGTTEDPLAGDGAPKARVPAREPDTGGMSPPTSARDHVLLGDLHMNNKNYKEAIFAYQKAAELAKDSDKAEIYRKLAQVYLHLKDDTAAEDAVRKAADFLRKHDPKANPGAANNPTKPALPAKLIVTASKKFLDQAAAGKVTADDFKKGVVVEYLSFPLGPGQKK